LRRLVPEWPAPREHLIKNYAESIDTLRFNFQERKLIGYFISEQCRAGERVSFSVKDTVGDSNDLTGALWSNNVTVICF
jgi:hypothetical protein